MAARVRQRAGAARPGRADRDCRRCPRLVEWREAVAADPPRRYRGEPTGRARCPGFGDPAARLVVVGLAPAAHGANRTGRMFTGDRSGEWLYARPAPRRLRQPADLRARRRRPAPRDAYITAIVRCAPPANKPTPVERDELPSLARRGAAPARAARASSSPSAPSPGTALLRALRELGHEPPKPKPRFAHGAEAEVGPYSAARLLPPLPAEHVHRQAHGGDARRGARPSARAERQPERGARCGRPPAPGVRVSWSQVTRMTVSPRAGEALVAVAIRLEGRARRVEPEAVELDDEAVLAASRGRPRGRADHRVG